jgi:hypothetical protein
VLAWTSGKEQCHAQEQMRIVGRFLCMIYSQDDPPFKNYSALFA